MFFLKDSLTKRTPRLFFPEENDETVDALLLSTSNIVNSRNIANANNNANIATANTNNLVSIPNMVVCPNHVDTTVNHLTPIEEIAVSPDPIQMYEETGDDEEEIDEKPLFVNIQTDWPESEQNSAAGPREHNSEAELRGVKRKAVNWDGGEVALDEDVNFAKSIVGFLRKLNPIRKLMVRNEIQSVLLRELLCDKCRCKGQQRACQCE